MQDPASAGDAGGPTMGWRAALAAPHRWRGTALAILVVAVLGGWLGPRLVLGPKVPVTTVVQRDFVQSVVASGHVEAPHRVTIGTQIVGNVQRVPVSEGQSVVAGQVLLELERSKLQAAAAQAEMAVVQAQARLRQLREVQAPVAEQALREAELNRDNARAQPRRNTDLFGTTPGSRRAATGSSRCRRPNRRRLTAVKSAPARRMTPVPRAFVTNGSGRRKTRSSGHPVIRSSRAKCLRASATSWFSVG